MPDAPRRDQWLARAASRVPDTGGRRARQRVLAVVLGWMVLMTIWGFGRAWHGGLAPVELVVGLAAGTITTTAAWRRADRGP